MAAASSSVLPSLVFMELSSPSLPRQDYLQRAHYLNLSYFLHHPWSWLSVSCSRAAHAPEPVHSVPGNGPISSPSIAVTFVPILFLHGFEFP